MSKKISQQPQQIIEQKPKHYTLKRKRVKL